MSISTDTIIEHYRIISKLDAGGMGEVYLAQDTKLDRKVALKISHLMSLPMRRDAALCSGSEGCFRAGPRAWSSRETYLTR